MLDYLELKTELYKHYSRFPNNIPKYESVRSFIRCMPDFLTYRFTLGAVVDLDINTKDMSVILADKQVPKYMKELVAHTYTKEYLPERKTKNTTYINVFVNVNMYYRHRGRLFS